MRRLARQRDVSSEKARGPHWLFGVGPAGSREKLRPYLVRLDVEGPVLATALGKIPIQVVAKPLRDFGLGSHEIPDAVIFGG